MIVGIFGGWTAGTVSGVITSQNFIYGIQYDFIPYYIVYSLIKTLFFAFIITSISSFQGYYVDGGCTGSGTGKYKSCCLQQYYDITIQCNINPTSTVMIRVKNLNKSFNGNTVLENISVTFETGKTNLIIGRSGSGKTVLLNQLSDFIKLTAERYGLKILYSIS